MKKTDIECYAAGGAVRDLLLGRRRRDVDYVCINGQKNFIQRNPGARKIENGISTHYLLNGQEFSFLAPVPGREKTALAADLLRRDFTINALLLSPHGVIHAHPSAFADLGRGIIRPASPSALFEDPVRVFRAARFSAEFPDFSLHEDCLEQMRSVARRGLLDSIAAEQVGKECLKACGAVNPGNFLRILRDTGCLAPWFAEFARGGSLPAGPPAFHDGTVLEHTAEVMDRTAAIRAEYGPGQVGHSASLAAWMALCHDLGKCATAPEVLPRHLGHENRGAGMAYLLGKRLRLSNQYCKAGQLASELHMKAGRYADLRPGTRVDLLIRLHGASMALPFFILVAADSAQSHLPGLMGAELDRILAVKLPSQWRNKGKASGEYLRQMRCKAITAG